MNKDKDPLMNIRIFMITAALLLAALASPSSAAFFSDFKTVGSNVSTAEQTSFSLSETPYLYYKLSSPVVSGKIITTWLLGSDAFVLKAPTTPAGEGWLSLTTWDTVKKAGTWDIRGYLKDNGTYSDCKTTSFVVTPEPMAMVLYGLGGLPITVFLYRRRKTAA
jgi:hypothetical protein